MKIDMPLNKDTKPLAQLAGAIECADSTSVERYPPGVLNLIVRLELWGMWSTISLLLLPGPLCSRVVILVGVPSIGQIELFIHLLYWKPFDCVQTNENVNWNY